MAELVCAGVMDAGGCQVSVFNLQTCKRVRTLMVGPESSRSSVIAGIALRCSAHAPTSASHSIHRLFPDCTDQEIIPQVLLGGS